MLCILGVLLMGCEESRTNILENDVEFPVSYISFLKNCSTIYDVNISDAWGICGAKHNVLTSFVSTDNWSVTCCDYNDKCYNSAQANFSNICSYDSDDSSSFSWEYTSQGWVGLCCDLNTGLCFEQANADVTLNNSCQTNFTVVTSTIFQNDSLWDAWCCVSGGLE